LKKSIGGLFLLWAVTLAFTPTSVMAQIDARMMRNPHVSQTQIVFSYAGDLWLVPKEGGTAVRLSSPKGEELYPRFSPDGKSIAYSANYEGNTDVYVIPTVGGAPVRVTSHGYPDRVLTWYPDGSRILFASAMTAGRQRYNQFFSVRPNGGLPEKLPLPYGEMASFSPDGKKIAYTYVTQAFRTWKRYRGGWAPDIHLFDLGKMTDENITANIANDEFPMYYGNTIYFLSDRGSELRSNIWAYDLGTKQTRQITIFKDFDICFPSLGPKEIVFEAGGRLYLLDLATEKCREVPVKVVTDEITLLPHTVNANKLIQEYSIAPDGKRLLIEARGEIFSVPAENGPAYNLTRTSGSAERYPAWSPDGKRAAYWSDRSGEYELTLYDFENRSERTVSSYGPGYRYHMYWSPNSAMIAFIDNTMRIRVYDVEKDRTVEVDKCKYLYQGGLSGYTVSWSPDSRWLAYEHDLENRSSAICLFDTKEGKSTQVTSGYYPDMMPSFDPDGKYLYFLTNRTFAPIYGDFDNTWTYPNTTVIGAAALNDDVLSPLAPKNDTTALVAKPATDDKKEKKDEKADAKKDEKKEEKPKETKITLAGFEQRVVILPPAAGNIGGVAGVAGKVLFVRAPNTGSADKKRSLMYYDLDKREEKTVVDDIDFFRLSADGKKVLVVKGENAAVVDVAESQKMDKKVPNGDLKMTVDPRAEWRQMFTDTWRFERDFFYDPNMHGVDWNAMRTRYAKLLESAVTRWDVNYVVGELIAELNASHTYRGGGDVEQPVNRSVGYLGIDWELAGGAYRIKNIINGAAWDTEARSPLLMSGLKVKQGDYILAVNGEPIDISRAPWEAFQGLAEQTVELMVNSKASMDGAWRITVKTLADESRLRNLAWIESNRRRVDEASGGRIGYVYVPSTAVDGQTELVRQFSAQFMKDGLIIDERFNSGGQIPDRFIELLDRKPLGFYAVRDGKNWQWPPVAHFGPKVMLINGWSGSGGDAFPDHFRKAGLGALIGTRTWGGLIGISGAPGLIDGGNITVPTFRLYQPDGTWFKEGHGVEPDISVPEDPAELAKGVDTQLERGIQEVMKKLKESPSPYPKQPSYEKR
jgi:tricorn protease